MIHGNPIKRKDQENEDGLTSSVFRLLAYLPPEKFKSILCEAVTDAAPLEGAGKLADIQSWPTWNFAKEDERKRNIPDLFLRFEHLDLIVEAKRFNEGQQLRRQWAAEIKAYYDQSFKSKKLVLLALGGLHRFETETVSETTVLKSTWSRLLNAVTRRYREVPKSSIGISVLYSDIILQFERFKFHPIRWAQESTMMDYPVFPNIQNTFTEWHNHFPQNS